MRYAKGWSSERGRATHYFDTAITEPDLKRRAVTLALCGSPIRITADELAQVVMRLKRLEVCDHCQRERRKRRRR